MNNAKLHTIQNGIDVSSQSRSFLRVLFKCYLFTYNWKGIGIWAALLMAQLLARKVPSNFQLDDPGQTDLGWTPRLHCACPSWPSLLTDHLLLEKAYAKSVITVTFILNYCIFLKEEHKVPEAIRQCEHFYTHCGTWRWALQLASHAN